MNKRLIAAIALPSLVSTYLLGLVAPVKAEGVNWWINPKTQSTELLAFGQGAVRSTPIIAQARQQTSWQAVSTNDAGDRFFVDRNSVSKRGNIVYFRDMVIYGAPQNGVSGIASLKSANCATGQYRARQITTYDLNRKVQDSFTDGDRAPLYTVKPGSSLATVLQSACNTR